MLHAEASDPIPVVSASDGSARLCIGAGAPGDALDHGFLYPGEVIGGLWDDPSPGREEGITNTGAGSALTRASATQGGEAPPLGHVVRVLLHGNGFLDGQLATMVGGALAVQQGHLSAGVLRAALILPACPPLPIAPPGGLVLVRIRKGTCSASTRHSVHCGAGRGAPFRGELSDVAAP